VYNETFLFLPAGQQLSEKSIKTCELNTVSNEKFEVTVLSIHLKVVKERNVAVFNADSILKGYFLRYSTMLQRLYA
jgi:hypothetical protein